VSRPKADDRISLTVVTMGQVTRLDNLSLEATVAERAWRSARDVRRAQRPYIIIVDMTRTRFVIQRGLASWYGRTSGRWPKVASCGWVIPAGGAVFRVFTLTGRHGLIPWFGSLDQALIREPTPAIRAPGPHAPVDAALRGSPADRTCPCEAGGTGHVGASPRPRVGPGGRVDLAAD
jgi:hypothetical protein